MSHFTPEITSQLAAPFPADAVQWKAQATNRDKTRALAVAYIDARNVMERLDQVVGPENWTDSYRVIDLAGSPAIECTLTVYGISKTDVGTAGDAGDPAKAAYSDALKRAAVKFGIGRYLYALPKVWVNYDPQRRQLAETPNLPHWAQSPAPAAQLHAPAPAAQPRRVYATGELCAPQNWPPFDAFTAATGRAPADHHELAAWAANRRPRPRTSAEMTTDELAADLFG